MSLNNRKEDVWNNGRNLVRRGLREGRRKMESHMIHAELSPFHTFNKVSRTPERIFVNRFIVIGCVN